VNHPFQILLPEYVKLLSTMTVTRAADVDRTARKLIDSLHLPRYQAVQDANGVPILFTAPTDERESGANPRCGLGQGDPWAQVSTHVPKGQGPFKSWSDATIFYEHFDHVDDVSVGGWSWPYLCWKEEAWNGFGPRAHGIHTGYLWGGSQHYQKGKYVADGVWDPNHVDAQLGVIPIARRMAELDPSLNLPGLPSANPGLTPLPAQVPAGAGGVSVAGHDVAWLQAGLNKVAHADLVVDGNYGRMTRTAVWAFQKRAGITADGLFGSQTEAALVHVIQAMPS